jgi:hypothetical protein
MHLHNRLGSGVKMTRYSSAEEFVAAHTLIFGSLTARSIKLAYSETSRKGSQIDPDR